MDLISTAEMKNKLDAMSLDSLEKRLKELQDERAQISEGNKRANQGGDKSYQKERRKRKEVLYSLIIDYHNAIQRKKA